MYHYRFAMMEFDLQLNEIEVKTVIRELNLERTSYGEVNYANTNKTNISNLLYSVYVYMPLLHGHLLALYQWKDEDGFCSILSVAY